MKIVSKGFFKSIQQFHFFDQKKLGNGSFGIVKLAIHMPTNKLYAIKIINLQDIPSQIQAKLIQRQIKLQSQISHPHIVKLWDTLIDQKNIYMILQYAEKGNLFYYQNSKIKFTQPQAFVFFSQTVKAVESLHNNNIFHRDLKPENLLLDQFYNVKICDFGWCAQNIHTRRATFCGTYQYMAPEMIFNSHYDYRVDIWALGVLLYEMVHGYAPFKGESVNDVKQKMLKCSYSLNQSLSQNLKDLIISLLKFDPNERITLNNLFNHSWFQKMEILISTMVIESKVYEPIKIHELICKIPNQNYVKSVDSSHYYTHNLTLDNKLFSNCNSSRQRKIIQTNFKKAVNNQYSDFIDKQTRNININFSINNFSYIQDNKSQRKNMFSPGQAFSNKKNKSFYKRIHSQTSDQSSILKSIDKRQKKSKTKHKQSLSIKKSEKNSKISEKSLTHKQSEKHPHEVTSTVMEKIAANLKKHAIKDKNNPYSSNKNIKNFKSKSKQKINFNEFSYL